MYVSCSSQLYLYVYFALLLYGKYNTLYHIDQPKLTTTKYNFKALLNDCSIMLSDSRLKGQCDTSVAIQLCMMISDHWNNASRKNKWKCMKLRCQQ